MSRTHTPVNMAFLILLLICFSVKPVFSKPVFPEDENISENTFSTESETKKTESKIITDKKNSNTLKKAEQLFQDQIEEPYNTFSGNTYLSYNDMKNFSDENPFYILSAFLLAYPDKIRTTGYDFRAKDWFLITESGVRLYWAKGRILPEKSKDKYQEFKPYVFYLYPETPYSKESFSEKDIEYFKSDNFLNSRKQEPDYEFTLYEELFGIRNRQSVEQNLETVYIFGIKTSVNKNIRLPLEKALEEINQQAETSKEIKEFIDTISDVHGYNWRKIRDSDSMSYHSLALAFDLVPKNWDIETIYWNWTRVFEEDWLTIPFKEKWSPPETVIEIFEKNGFIWGGKWDLWDNMHFEYRPELILLQNLLKGKEQAKK